MAPVVATASFPLINLPNFYLSFTILVSFILVRYPDRIGLVNTVGTKRDGPVPLSCVCLPRTGALRRGGGVGVLRKSSNARRLGLRAWARACPVWRRRGPRRRIRKLSLPPEHCVRRRRGENVNAQGHEDGSLCVHVSGHGEAILMLPARDSPVRPMIFALVAMAPPRVAGDTVLPRGPPRRDAARPADCHRRTLQVVHGQRGVRGTSQFPPVGLPVYAPGGTVGPMCRA